MANTIAQFAERMKKRGDQIENAGARVIRRSTRAFVREVVLGTPVDTGKHRSNWRVGIDRRPGGVIQPYAPGRKLGIAERSNATATIAAAEVQIAKIRPGRGRKVDFNVFVVNNAPVIGKLNAGQISTQQTPGWINAALLTALSKIRTMRIFNPGPEF